MEISNQNQEFLKNIKLSVQKQMKERNICASVLGALAISQSNYGKNSYVNNSNNLYKMEVSDTENWFGKCVDPITGKIYDKSSEFKKKTTLYRAYNSYDESIDDFASYLVSNRRSSNGPLKYSGIIGVTNYKKSLKILERIGYLKDFLHAYDDNRWIANMESIIEKYKMYEWDDEVIKDIGVFKGETLYVKYKNNLDDTIIFGTDIEKLKDICLKNNGSAIYTKDNKLISDPWADKTEIYRVRLYNYGEYDLNSSPQIDSSTDIEYVKKVASSHTGYVVIDEKFNIIFDPWKVKEENTHEFSVLDVIMVSPGRLIEADNISLYHDHDSKNPFMFISGIIYYYDDKIINGRARVTRINDPEMINGKNPSCILGWINII